MGRTFCSILTAYLLGEFIYRSAWINKRTRVVWAATVRCAAIRGVIVTIISGLLIGRLDWGILLGILVASTAMAVFQMRAPDSIAWFGAGQSLSLLILLGLAWYFPDAAAKGWYARFPQPDLPKWYFAILSCISGLVACVPAGGVLIGKIMRPFTDEIRDDEIAGLINGGLYIGWLERLLVLLVVLMDQPNGIGFLIAAKSILRFGEIKEASQRKVAEYIIIGTFASFGWALFISVLTQKAIKYWMS